MLHTLVVQDDNDDNDDDESHGVRVHVKFCVVTELCESLCFLGVWLPAAVQVIDHTSFTVLLYESGTVFRSISHLLRQFPSSVLA